MLSHQPGNYESILFKNLDNISPSDELTDEFLLQLPHQHSQTSLSNVSTISKLTDEILLKLAAPHNQDLMLDDDEPTPTARCSF